MAEPRKKPQRRSADVQRDQGLRQDEQGATQVDQGVVQIEQGITQVAQGIKQEAQADAMAAQIFDISAVRDGVQTLAKNVETLNERVYAKSELDRTRNHLLIVSVVTFVVLSFALGTLLWRINNSAREDAVQAQHRSAEAIASRRALADCTNPPGTVLDNGFINPGVCFNQTAERTQNFINDAIDRIFTGLRFSSDCLYLRGQSVRPLTCAAVNARVDALKGGANPFGLTTTTTMPPLREGRATTVQVPSLPAPSPPRPVPPTSPPSRNLLATLVCMVIGFGGC